MPRQPVSCYEQAVKFLTRRDHSEFELKEKLRRKNHASQDIEETVERLQESGYLCDERFAISRMRHRALNCGWGVVRIRAELAELRVASQFVEKAFEAFAEEEGGTPEWWQQRAAELLKRRYSEKPEGEKEKVQRANFLLRRGFTTDQTMKALSSY